MVDLISKKNKISKYLKDWFDLCEDEENFPTSEDIKLLNELIKKKIKIQKIWVDEEKVDGIIDLIEKYRPYKLAVVQKFLHCIPYIYYPNGKQVWKEGLLFSGRGFGKNSFISDFSFGATSNKNNIKNYNIDIVATSEDQAKTSFKDVYETTDNKEIERAYHKTLEEITFKNTNSTIKYYTSNAKTKDGLRPGCVVFDEIHAYESYENIKVFTSALGKVPNGFTFYITTNGYIRGGVLDDMLEEAVEVLKTQDLESELFPFICRIDKFEEWEDPKMWVKANPMLPFLPILKDEYISSYKKALKRPHMKIEFITKRLNWTIDETTHTVADWEDIKATNQEIDWNDFTRCQCVGGIDFASVRDFIAVGLLFKKNNKTYFKHHTFVVEESLRITNFKIDIKLAEQKGLVTIVPGKTFDVSYVTNWFIQQIKKYKFNILEIATDSYRSALIESDFKENGLPLTMVRSGPISHGKIAPVIEKKFADRNIIFGDDMMMRWYTNNVKVETDGKGNKTYKKIEPEKRKTDGFMAYVHAELISDVIKTSTKKLRKIKSYTYNN